MGIWNLFRRPSAAQPGWIDAAELRQRIASDTPPLILDVRQPAEFTAPPGHLPGAVNLPLAQVAQQAAQLAAQQQALVLVCKTDRRSARAAADLRAAGVQDVVVLRGGTDGWHQLGFPLE